MTNEQKKRQCPQRDKICQKLMKTQQKEMEIIPK